jgi:hypothetical protein
VVVSPIFSTAPVEVAATAVSCKLRIEPPFIDDEPKVSPVCDVRLFQFHVIAFAPLSMLLVVVAAVIPDSGTELAAPFTVIQLEPLQNSKVLLGETLPPVHCTMPAFVLLQLADVLPNQ